MHLAQGVVFDATGLGDVEQLLIGEALGDVADAPQQRQAIPCSRALQRMAPGAVPVVFEDRLPGLLVRRMPDAPFLQRWVKGCFIDLAALPDKGFVIDRMLSELIRH
ncbi:hypothetical protein D3C86_1831790 [compost metagenome]